MRIGVLGAASMACATLDPSSPLYTQYGCGIPDITGTITSGGQGSAPPTVTYGIDVNGNTISCPPGYPYDPGTKDCLGYAGSPTDLARIQLQADIDACTSGGGNWLSGECVMPVSPAPTPAPPVAGQLIQGVSNTVLYAGAGLLLVLALIGGRRR